MIVSILVLLLIFALFGASIFLILGALALLAFHSAGIDSSAIFAEMYRLASLPALVAIPLFTFAGYLLAESRAPKRFLGIAESLFGWIPGGLSVVSLFTCAFFTAFTGASGVTIIALGGLLYPMLRDKGYSEKYTLGLLTTTGSLGLLFPPSLPIILYGLIAQICIDQLFIAGLIPGLLLILVLMIYGFVCEKHPPSVPFSWKNVWNATRGAAFEIPLPFLILGGIYGGFFTATEASAIMAFYVFIVEFFIYRDLDFKKDLVRVIEQSMMLVGAILIMMGMALGLTSYLIDAQVPMHMFEWIHRYVSDRYFFLVLLNIFLLIMNMIQMFSAIIIVVPLILPVALQYGVDPLHLGIIFLLNLEIGYMTAPVGMNLFLSALRFEKPVTQIYRASLPFWLIMILVLILVTYVPELSLMFIHKG